MHLQPWWMRPQTLYRRCSRPCCCERIVWETFQPFPTQWNRPWRRSQRSMLLWTIVWKKVNATLNISVMPILGVKWWIRSGGNWIVRTTMTNSSLNSRLNIILVMRTWRSWRSWRSCKCWKNNYKCHKLKVFGILFIFVIYIFLLININLYYFYYNIL